MDGGFGIRQPEYICTKYVFLLHIRFSSVIAAFNLAMTSSPLEYKVLVGYRP